MTVHLRADWLIGCVGGVAVSAENDTGSVFVAQEGYLLVQQSTFRGGGCSCMDVRRWAGEYETDPDARTSKHALQLREGFRVCSCETKDMPGAVTGVWACEGIR